MGYDLHTTISDSLETQQTNVSNTRLQKGGQAFHKRSVITMRYQTAVEYLDH